MENGGTFASIKETVKTVVYALLIAGIFRTLFFQPFWIPSASMKPTLLVGDFLFVNKMAYGYSYASCPSIPFVGIKAEDFCGVFKGADDRLFGSDPEVGDVVVFAHPVDGREFIKRLIGKPGDRIQMKDGLLYINDAPVQVTDGGQFIEPYGQQGPQRSRTVCSNGAVGEGADCIKQVRVETLPNGAAYSTLNIRDNGPNSPDNTGVNVVPDGHFFFMGDNRDNSTDSRVAQTARGVGFVRREDIVGRADRIIFSSAGRFILGFWDWRSDRFFKAIE